MLKLNGHNGPVLCCCIYKSLIISAGYDKLIRIWSAENGTLMHVLTGHEHIITSIDIHHNQNSSDDFDQPLIISGSWDKTVCVWRLPLNNAVHKNKTKKIILARYNSSKSIGHTTSGDSEALLHRMTGHTNRVRCVKAVQATTNSQQNSNSNNEQSCLAASGGDDSTIIIWDLALGTIRFTLTGHVHFVLHLAVYGNTGDSTTSTCNEDENDFKLISYSSDRSMRVWCLKTGTQIVSTSDYVAGRSSSSVAVSTTEIVTLTATKISCSTINQIKLTNPTREGRFTRSFASTVSNGLLSKGNSLQHITIPEQQIQTQQTQPGGGSSTSNSFSLSPSQKLNSQQQLSSYTQTVLIAVDKQNNIVFYSLPADVSDLGGFNLIGQISPYNDLNIDSSMKNIGNIVSVSMTDCIESLHFQSISVDNSTSSTSQHIHTDNTHNNNNTNTNSGGITKPCYLLYLTESGHLGYVDLTQQTVNTLIPPLHNMNRCLNLNVAYEESQQLLLGGISTKGHTISALIGKTVKPEPVLIFHYLTTNHNTTSFHNTSNTSHTSNNNNNSNTNSTNPNTNLNPNIRYIITCGDDGTLYVKQYSTHCIDLTSTDSVPSMLGTPKIKPPGVMSPVPPLAKTTSTTPYPHISNMDDSGCTSSQKKHLLANYDSLLGDGGEDMSFDDSSKANTARARSRPNITSTNNNADIHLIGEDHSITVKQNSTTASNSNFWQSLVNQAADTQFSFARIKFHTKVPTATANSASQQQQQNGAHQGTHQAAATRNNTQQQAQNNRNGRYKSRSAAVSNGRASRGSGGGAAQQYHLIEDSGAQPPSHFPSNYPRPSQERLLLPMATNLEQPSMDVGGEHWSTGESFQTHLPVRKQGPSITQVAYNTHGVGNKRGNNANATSNSSNLRRLLPLFSDRK